jgi:hypothetical protein
MNQPNQLNKIQQPQQINQMQQQPPPQYQQPVKPSPPQQVPQQAQAVSAQQAQAVSTPASKGGGGEFDLFDMDMSEEAIMMQALEQAEATCQSSSKRLKSQ